MPLFNTDDQDSFKANGSGFKFSGVNINTLLKGASAYTLVGIGADRSTSVSGFAAEIEGCIKSSLEGCQRSPYVDQLLVRLVAFNQHVTQEHGFRNLSECHLAAYDGFLKPGGSTSLYDASVDLIDSLATYGKNLISQDGSANGIVVILTDGVDYGSSLGVNEVKAAMARALQSESLESLTSILIGINVTNPDVSQYLANFKNEVGFSQYIEAKDASPKTFARIAGFISKSVSSTSQAINSGAPSQLINF